MLGRKAQVLFELVWLTITIGHMTSGGKLISLYKTNERESHSKKVTQKSTFVTPWTVQSMEYHRPDYWNGFLLLSLRDLPTQGSNPGFLHCRWILYQLSHKGSSEKISICDLFSPLTKTFAVFTPCVLSSFLLPDCILNFLHSWIYVV